MASEKCPLCGGGGWLLKPHKTGGYIPSCQPCHGCNGKGWVAVGQDYTLMGALYRDSNGRTRMERVRPQ